MGAEVKWEGRGKGLFVHCVYSEAQQRVRSTGAIIKERGEYAVEGTISFIFLPGCTLFTSDNGMEQLPHSQKREIAGHAN